MQTAIPEKLLRIADDIEEHGSVDSTRLAVLTKWFEGRPERLRSFAIFVVNRASGRKGKTKGEAAKLFKETRILLKDLTRYEPHPTLPREEAELLYEKLRAFQGEHEQQQSGPTRIIRNKQLFLIEESLRIYLWRTDSPEEGYRLAVQYCENYDPRYGNTLNGPSYTKVLEVMRFMFTVEGFEELGV